jgi:hypothetical protein
MTVAEKLIEQGRQEGERKGMQLAILRLIEQRFGSVPPALVQLIGSSSTTEIDHWMRRILAAATLDELLT